MCNTAEGPHVGQSGDDRPLLTSTPHVLNHTIRSVKRNFRTPFTLLALRTRRLTGAYLVRRGNKIKIKNDGRRPLFEGSCLRGR